MKVTYLVEIEVEGLGDRIREARAKSGRSLVNICALVGMSTQNWYRIETEKQRLPLDTLRKIEKVLQVDLGVKNEHK